MDLNKKFQQANEVVVRKVDDEYLIVPLAQNVADMDSIITMNEIGSFIWDKVNGTNTGQDILHLILNEFEIDEETAKKDLIDFFENMKEFIIEK